MHIGQILKKAVEKKGFTAAEIAAQIGLTPGAFRKNYHKPSMQTDVILQVSKFIELNIFQEIAKELASQTSIPGHLGTINSKNLSDENIASLTEKEVTYTLTIEVPASKKHEVLDLIYSQ